MKINIKRYFLPLAAVLFMVGCHEAVEPEAIDVNYSSFEETNPELYARYMQALREYKAGSHKAVFVTMTVPENGAATTHRTQHFTAIPDSVDFIVVNPVPAVLCQTLVDEIRKVHEKGTRILFNIDLQTFENDWTQVLKEDPTLSEEDALAYLGGRVGEQIALVDRWGYDGFIFTYTGKAVGSRLYGPSGSALRADPRLARGSSLACARLPRLHRSRYGGEYAVAGRVRLHHPADQ